MNTLSWADAPSTRSPATEPVTSDQFVENIRQLVASAESERANQEAIQAQQRAINEQVVALEAEITEREQKQAQFGASYRQFLGSYASNSTPISEVARDLQQSLTLFGGVSYSAENREEVVEGINTIMTRFRSLKNDYCGRSIPGERQEQCRELVQSLTRLEVTQNDCRQVVERRSGNRADARTCAAFLNSLQTQLSSSLELTASIEQQARELAQQSRERREALTEAQSSMAELVAEQSSTPERAQLKNQVLSYIENLRQGEALAHLDASMLMNNSALLSQIAGLTIADASSILNETERQLRASIDDTVLGRYVSAKIGEALSCENLTNSLNSCRSKDPVAVVGEEVQQILEFTNPNTSTPSVGAEN